MEGVLAFSDSRVVDALAGDARMMERLLDALGVQHKGLTQGKLISCPMPHHEDRDPSCNPLVDSGSFYCHSLCETIYAADLVIAHGKASDRAGAMRWLEETLRLPGEQGRAGSAPAEPLVLDPSLSAEQYVAALGLPSEVVERFGLETVQSNHKHAEDPAERKGRNKLIAYEQGWYTSVFLPYGEGLQPRVRSDRPDRKTWPAQTIRHLKPSGSGFRVAKYHELPLAVYGLAQYEQLAQVPGATLIVEGESDILCLHAMGFKACLGIPGASACNRTANYVLEHLLHQSGGDTNLSELVLVVAAEPGKAGQAFPGKMVRALQEKVEEIGGIPPRFASLQWTSVLPNSDVGDARDLWMDRGVAALQPMVAAVAGACGRSGHAAQCAVGAGVVSAAQVEALSAAPARAAASDDPWADVLLLDGAPDMTGIGAELDGLGANFVRNSHGWAVEKKTEDGPEYHQICSPFVVAGVDRCGDKTLVRIAALQGSRWVEARFEQSRMADAGRACASLAERGVVLANRRRPDVADCASAMIRTIMSAGLIRDVPKGTGWSGDPGVSLFGGIEVEPVEQLPAMMFEANSKRRAKHPDVTQSAAEWWRVGVAPLLGGVQPAALRGAHAAPVLALGAAAAAPLIGPLASCGIGISPVAWLAGLGGGGKTTLQILAASIFAPKLPGLDGQASFFANADMSRAALSARGELCRDLPLILDDVMNLPGSSNTESRPGSNAAKVENAAGLGMMIFNQKPVERGTREGGLRLVKPFRSTALFSAEVSLADELIAAKASAGQHRRIMTVECRPMSDRGLEGSYAERVIGLASSLGGSAGDLLVRRIRDLFTARDLKALLDECLGVVREAAPGLESTQSKSLALILMGFGLLADVCGECSWSEALELASSLLMVYASDQGLTDDDLCGVDRTVAAVIDFRGTNPRRFQAPNDQIVDDLSEEHRAKYGPISHQEIWGRDLIDREGLHRVALTKCGVEELMRKYGVTPQMIGECVASGVARKGHKVDLWGASQVRTTSFVVPSGFDDDPDPSEPEHDPDPYGLRDAECFGPSGTGCPESDEATRALGEDPTAERLLSDGPVSIMQRLAGTPQLELKRGIHIGTDAEQRLVFVEGSEVAEAVFLWSIGMYRPGEADRPDSPQFRDAIRRDAMAEIVQLREMFEYKGITVEDPPADEDERWLKLDALGEAGARKLWTRACQASSHAAVPGLEPAERDARLAAHVKAYRLHILARIRHPEWFIADAA